MAGLTKKIEIITEVDEVLRRSEIAEVSGTQTFKLVLPGQLDRKLYEQVIKVLAAEGGKWNRKANGHLFSHDPREIFATALAQGHLEVPKDGWFETPPDVVGQMLDMAPWSGGEILEPSAGEGAIADVIIHRWPDAASHLLCIEKNEARAKRLWEKQYTFMHGDFLALELPSVFTRCWLNSPFEQGQDILHTMYAYSLLAHGGELIGIMSEGAFFRKDKQSSNFLSWLEALNGETIRLPDDAFKESGTNVRTRVVHLRKA